MGSANTHPYQKWVNIANGFYLLIGLVWLLMGLSRGAFNAMALGIVVVFGAQLYFKHLISNLILGIIFLFLSVFSLLEAINSAAAAARAHDLMLFDKVLVVLPLVSLAMSGILIFSYIKMGFKE